MAEALTRVFTAIDAFFARAADARTRAGTPAARRLPPAPSVAAQPKPPQPPPAGSPRTLPPTGPAAAEAGLVRGLFASPQSLAAAVIAAEILAKPVALRDR